jgi:hypothetical protein
MMRGQNRPSPKRLRVLRDCFVAGGPRRGLETVPPSSQGADPNPQGLEGHPPCLGKRSAVVRPCIGSGLQTVMDVNSVQYPLLGPPRPLANHCIE